MRPVGSVIYEVDPEYTGSSGTFDVHGTVSASSSPGALGSDRRVPTIDFVPRPASHKLDLSVDRWHER